MTDYINEAEEIASAMNAVYENKQTNKKNDISGDFSTDNVSYPTVKAAKDEFGHKVTSFGNNPSDSNYPSEKLVKDNFDDLESSLTTDLTIDVVKQGAADAGYASTYYLTQGGVQVGAKINVAKDKMVRSISVETVGATPTTEETSYNMSTGDQYILMIVNTVDNDGTSRLVLPITDVFDLQSADESTLTLNANGVFSIKNGGVGLNQIATSVKNSWLTTNDVQTEISSFATALANAINPSS